MIKIFVSDLDGTLLNTEHECDERIISCVQGVLDHGCEFVIATGRTVQGVKQFKELWNLPVPIVALNGALVLNREKQTIHKRPIAPKVIAEFTSQFSDCHVEYFTDEKTFIMRSREAYLESFTEVWNAQGFEKVGSMEMLESLLEQHIFDCPAERIAQNEILKINIREQESTKIARIELILEQFKDAIINAPFQKGIMELTAQSVSKLSGIYKLLEGYSIRQDEVVVFGDGGNDVQMLQGFANSFAVENASQEAKEVAANIIKSNSEYGVITTIQALLKGETYDGNSL